MVDQKTLLSQVKAATLGIGVLIMESGKAIEVDIHGTGFFANSIGYVMTASHVVYSCRRAVQNKMREKIDAELIAIQLRYLSNGGFKLSFILMHEPFVINMGRPDQVLKSGVPQGVSIWMWQC